MSQKLKFIPTSKRTDLAITAFHFPRFPAADTTMHFADFPDDFKCTARLLNKRKSAGDDSSSVITRTSPLRGRVGMGDSDIMTDM